MAEMVTIPGVARKTANVVLGNAYGVVEGIAVDTHVLRLSQRLGLVSRDKIGGGKKPLYYIKSGVKHLDYYKDASPEKIERELMKIIPKKDWFKLTYLLIDHGREICKAQNPDCYYCPLRELCPVSRI
ncbi:MAG: Endonuclease III [Candidatus Woesebacteria bacterium GW2011_GWA2_44_33]|uniref:Endonuclease III n=1 Tax=Candidatus Woesebacteria bacterium GW2011_GWA2_44_33 TaxID=1618564 RepID=A0A0G1J2I1_9BACT|nr:MAG: Endonuclease III [Candidatus Woesebacteria bacterium GW2011_GWA2_44_33]